MTEPQDRQIRVFVSSTFRDMGAERDHLVKFVFPQLRKLCESRGVTWGEVDLRWGVTNEEAAEGKVLPICLEEIKRCRPYFIGILGERYGWVPGTISPELIEREPWLKEQMQGHKSVTELEILHGVLNNPAMAGHAFFYLRDPDYLNHLPSGAKRPDYVSEDAASAAKLRDLKKRLAESSFTVWDRYKDIETFGRLVLDDLTGVINNLWPEGTQLDPLDREAMDHEAFAQSRARVYIGRHEYFDRLDAHANGSGDQPLVILGESGSGKSALLANWAIRYRQQYSSPLLLMHFIGGTPYSSDWAAMLRRIMGEFKRKFGITQDIPGQPDALRSAFANWLHMASAKVGAASSLPGPTKIILILDALNQLEDRDGAPDLVWLPPEMPENLRLIVSTLPGRALDKINKRQWPVLKVEPLDTEERRKLITDYLGQYTKSLSPARIERIASAPQSASPLYLRVLLDELRVFGEHERLDERINHYLRSQSIPELFERVLARWEQDYEGDTDLVGDAMSLLWAARRGLSEAELLDALGGVNKNGEREPLPRAKWSPLFLAAADSLVSHGGLLTFFHDYLREAVQLSYLPSKSGQKATHLRLAGYFEARHQLAATPRQAEEWPYQLHAAEAWDRLEACLTDIPLFLTLSNDREKWELTHYWQPLRKLGRNMGECYAASYARWSTDPGKAGDPFIPGILGGFLLDNGQHAAAEPFLRRGMEATERMLGAEHPSTLGWLRQMAQWHESNGDRAEALRLRERVGQSGDEGTPMNMYDRAGALQSRGDYTGAQRLYEQSLRGWEQMLGPEHPDTLTCMSNLAGVLQTQGKYAEAQTLFERSLAGRERVLGVEHPSTLESMSNLAGILQSQGKYAKAETLFEQSLAGRERVLGMEHPSTLASMDHLAALLQGTGELAKAKMLYERALAGKENVFGAASPETLTCMNNLAVLLQEMGEFAKAHSLLERSVAGCERALGAEHPNTLVCMGNVALLLERRQDYHRAELLYERVLAVKKRTLGEQHASTLTTMSNLAELLKKREAYRKARQLCESALRGRGLLLGIDHPDTLGSLNNLAGILECQGYCEPALPLYERAVIGLVRVSDAIGREHPNFHPAAVNYVNLLVKTGTPRDQAVSRIQALSRESLHLTNHELAALDRQTEAVLNSLPDLAKEPPSQPRSQSATPTVPLSVSRGRSNPAPQESAASAPRRESPESAGTHLQKQLDRGEPVQTVVPELITSLLNAHEVPTSATIDRVQKLISGLEEYGHFDLALAARRQLEAKLPQTKKPWWKVW